MKPRFNHLLAPLELRGQVLKNRMTAATSAPHFLQGPESFPTETVLAHYANKAKGAAMVTCMGINNCTRGKQMPMDLDFGHFPDYDLYDTASQNYLLQLADTIHFYDSLASMCLFVGPPSAYLLMHKKGAPPEQGDVHGLSRKDGKPFEVPKLDEFDLELIEAHKLPHEYEEAVLEKIARSYAEQAAILRSLDFDAVTLHFAYRANLPAKFLSPLTNHRTDAWGGSLENRMRFPLAVLRKVREAVGPRMLIELVHSAEETPGGYTLDDSVVFLNEAAKYIDLVQLRAAEADPAHPTGFTLAETPFLHYAAYIKERVPGLAIASIGGYHDPEISERAIAEGKLDVVAMARAWLSNPDYGRLVREGRTDDIVPCLRCNKCHGRGDKDPFQSVCSVNPLIGLEHKIERMILPVTAVKKAAVAGGGPAGMQCAITLADRGHQVTLYEAADHLGGAMAHADQVDFKWPLRRYKDYLVLQIGKRKNIEVRLNSPVTAEALKPLGYDVVIAALGAVPLRPQFPGLEDHGSVFTAVEAITAHEKLGGQVVIIGGGEVGVETGIALAQWGRQVTVLEMRDELAADSTKIHYYSMFKAAWEAQPSFHALVKARVCEIAGKEVVYTGPEGEKKQVRADSIVLSVGMTGKRKEALSLYGIAPEFYMIGDCKTPATVQQAIRAAYSTAVRI
jgi:2,4-dienoyl-CoA reductase-like NADH-dependent reductase (Old Yellow Enzyme family)/thioredoxin reductase